MKYNDLLHKLTNALPLGLLVLSGDKRVLVWNDSAEMITSIKKSEIIGTHHDNLPREIIELLNRETVEITLQTQDLGSRFIKKSIHEIDLNGGNTNLVVIFSDITDMLDQKHEMEVMLMETADTKDLMEEQAAELAMALAEVNEKNDIIEGQNKKMVDELKMAGRLQKSLLPNIYENFNGVSVSSKYIPSIHIGGDLYDVVDLGQGMTGFLIADVSGHGVAAALVSSMFKMSFHALAANVASPKILFHMLNQEFNPILAEDYITSFYLLADSTADSITFSNAGHPTPLLYKKRTSEIIEIDTDGFFLGMFDDGIYEEKTVTGIENGDALLLYTDCILETENARAEPFGKNRLIKSFARAIEESHGQDVIDRIEAEVRVFNAKESFDDDFTVLLLEFWEQAKKVDLDPTDRENGESDGFIEF
jgi:serine phosphatase RsbU (regulator of sigma subunit)